MNNRGTLKIAAALATATLIASGTAHASLKCRETVAKESSKLTQAIAKALQKCEQSVLDAKILGPCPDTATATKISGAKSKLKAAIQKQCTGSTGEFAFGRCPNETGADVGNNCGAILINTKGDEADCLSCLADHNATELVHRVLYGSLKTGGSSDVSKCQKTVGQSTTKFYAAASKVLAKCQGGLLKKKIPSCPDAATTAALDKAESKKVAAITKDCCGPDGVCGGATCSATLAPKIECVGGTNAGAKCSADSACPGGTCTNQGVSCIGGSNTGNPCLNDSECPQGRCAGGAAGEHCEATRDCGRCRGGTQPGKPCSADGQCQSSPGNCDTSAPKRCIGGTNADRPCVTGTDCNSGVCSATCISGANADAPCTVDSECPGSTCSLGTCTGGSNDGNPCHANGDCPSISAGNCVGAGGVCQGGANQGAGCSADSACPGSTCGPICGGIDDLSPSATIGLPVPCPGLTTGSSAIVQTGVSGLSLLECVDTQSSDRAKCQDSVAGTQGGVPTFCVDTAATCSISGGTQQVTIDINTGSFSDIAGIVISLGYETVAFPGINDVSNSSRIVNLQVAGQKSYNDDDSSLTLGLATSGGLTTGALYHVTFDKCGTTPTPANFGCVVVSASDDNGVDIGDGVSCSVTVP